MPRQNEMSHLLKSALLMNAGFSALIGVDMLLLADWVAWIIGFENLMALQILGSGLILWAITLVFLAGRPAVSPLLIRGVILADLGWVLGTALLLILASSWFSMTGVVLLIITAAIVSLFAVLQEVGLKRTKSTSAG